MCHIFAETREAATRVKPGGNRLREIPNCKLLVSEHSANIRAPSCESVRSCKLHSKCQRPPLRLPGYFTACTVHDASKVQRSRLPPQTQHLNSLSANCSTLCKRVGPLHLETAAPSTWRRKRILKNVGLKSLKFMSRLQAFKVHQPTLETLP